MNTSSLTAWKPVLTGVVILSMMIGCGGRPATSKNMSPIVEDDPAINQQLEAQEKQRLDELAEQHRLAKQKNQLPNLPPELLPGGAPPKQE